VKSRISGKEAVYVARESERRRPVKLLASDRVDGVSVEQARCGARTPTGTPCQRPAVRGRKRCRLHGGLSPGAPSRAKEWQFQNRELDDRGY
jgi:hypothetical protein